MNNILSECNRSNGKGTEKVSNQNRGYITLNIRKPITKYIFLVVTECRINAISD